jgi:hypothetical protein
MSLAGTKMSSPYPFTSQEIALANEVAAFTMKVARPLDLADVQESWPKRLLGGTCLYSVLMRADRYYCRTRETFWYDPNRRKRAATCGNARHDPQKWNIECPARA